MNGHDRNHGFTLLEVVIVAALVVLIFGETIYMSLRIENHLGDEVTRLTIDETAKRVARRVATELMQAYPSSVTPSVLDGDELVQFQKVIGYSGGVELGPVNSIQFQLATGELDNGQDDNGDGRIDEGILVHTVAGNPAITVAANLLGLGFTSSTGGISFAFDIGLVGDDRAVVQRSYTRQVGFRN